MSRRERQVYPTNEIAHLWAHKTQQSARNQQGNFYFEGDTIYSYGSHFPIAKHITRKGENAVLFTTRRSYSNTTSKHICDVRRAIPGRLPVFHVPHVDASASNGLESYRKRIKDLEQTARKSKGLMLERLNSLRKTVDEASSYAEFFGLKSRFHLPADWDDLREKAAELNQTRLVVQRLSEWLAGQPVSSYPYLGYLDKVYLRVQGDEIETTRGARFPVEHGKRAISIVRKCKAEGREFRTNGHAIHLGLYTLDRIDTEGNVTAGCHDVTYDEVERIAQQLGV